MRLTLNVYRLVKMVQNSGNEVDQKFFKNFDRMENRISMVEMRAVKRALVDKYKLSSREANNVCEYAIAEHYLNKKVDELEGIDMVVETDKGLRILDTLPVLHFIPVGLLKAWWEEDKTSVKDLLH